MLSVIGFMLCIIDFGCLLVLLSSLYVTNLTFLTSQIAAGIGFKFCLDVLWIYSLTKFVKIGMVPLIVMKFWVILCNVLLILSLKPQTRNH